MDNKNKKSYTIRDALVAAQTYFGEYDHIMGYTSSHINVEASKEYIIDARKTKSSDDQEMKVKWGVNLGNNSDNDLQIVKIRNRVKLLGNTTHFRRGFKRLDLWDRDLIILAFHDSISKIPRYYYDMSWVKINGVFVNLCLPVMYVYKLLPEDLSEQKKRIRKQQWIQMMSVTTNYFNKSIIKLRDEMNKELLVN